MPSAPRWDYAIGYSDQTNQERIVWVEVHPATSGRNLDEMVRKLDWLVDWLQRAAPAMNYGPRRIVWVASSRARFSKGDPKLRALNRRGLEFAGSHLAL